MPDASQHDVRAQILTMLEQAADGSLPEIVQAGHPTLRAPAQPWNGQLSASELEQFVELMRRCMHAAPGVGLAAPQLGVSLQLAVLEDGHQVDSEIASIRERSNLPFFAMLNPRYQPLNSKLVGFYEGCLSMSGWQAVVYRHHAIQLAYTTVDGELVQREFAGWPARIVQHETDHLAGMLYLDKAKTRSLTNNAEYSSRWAQPGIELAQRELNF